MKHRTKPMKTEEKNSNINYNSSSSNLPCYKHPYNTSSIGICAYCLKEKLRNLICSYCGEKRISSCSCSCSFSSYRSLYSTLDVGSIGSVGRMSFLIENDKGITNEKDPKSIFSNMLKMKHGKTEEREDFVLLKRSNSCVNEVKKDKGFWKVGSFFKKKREQGGFSERNKVMDISRTRSFSSFMDDSRDCSNGKMSDFHELELRDSGLVDFEKEFVAKESNFSRMNDDIVNDDEFIDLKIDLFDKSKTEYSAFKKCDPLDLVLGDCMGSSSCRFMVNERGIKKVKNSHMKAWKWIFKQHSGKKDLNHILKS